MPPNRLRALEPETEWQKHRQALHKLILQYRMVETGDLKQADHYHDKILQYVAYMCKLGVQPPERKDK
jgi:hypothetical protein